ncbi:hypothetical protein BREVNS_2443 [Brevinematales bacterium NS]|nr:DUF4914 family protein [Brevinematales bacterium]QJR23193.1 hypothetical protein BREVNS_2443 [Brevinematales bacterium NS]
MKDIIHRLHLPKEIGDILQDCPGITTFNTRQELIELSLGFPGNNLYEVKYTLDNTTPTETTEATVIRCKNGIVVNYPDPYMRRRDPNSMVIGDEEETDKPTFQEKYGRPFDEVRKATFEWLSKQELLIMPFVSGDESLDYYSLLIAPKNAAFFALMLGDIQGFIPFDSLPKDFKPLAIVYVAPTFRHTHFDGKQIVVHNRLNHIHEVFSYNLYPGPSAKKGVYSVLLDIGEKEGWLSVHASSVKVITPYDNELVMLHEGASGGGKSELHQQIRREKDNKIVLATHLRTQDKIYLELNESCDLMPITDDITLVHPKFQKNHKKMVIKDAEQGWFVRVDNIPHYGTDPHLESICTQPAEPLVFLNIDAVPNSTALIWEHIEDAPGKKCPNPRVILPKRLIPDVIDQAVAVDVRSFGVRTPPCFDDAPSYGIIGIAHVLPPALAWLWRLVSPRGHANPSITSNTAALSSEGVGSFWPFATGKMVRHANLLLEQFQDFTDTLYLLIPNQHIGAYKVGFMPEWVVREYLAKRGSARIKPSQLVPARCSLLGYALEYMKFEGIYIPKSLLQVNLQSDVGDEAYDKGAEMLQAFFKEELKQFLTRDLSSTGRRIIECCLDNGSVQDYEEILH